MNEEEGTALYDESRKPTEYTQNMLKFISNYEKDYLNTLAVAKALKEKGVLESHEFKLTQNDQTHVLAKGFLTVDREKLNSLDDETLATWARLGYMGIIDLHTRSLVNVRNLLNIAATKK